MSRRCHQDDRRGRSRQGLLQGLDRLALRHADADAVRVLTVWTHHVVLRIDDDDCGVVACCASYLDLSAIDEQLCARHEAALIGREKYYGGGDFLGPAESAHGDARRKLAEQGLFFAGWREAGQARSQYRSGHDGVDTDVVADEFGRPGSSERSDCGFSQPTSGPTSPRSMATTSVY